MCAQHLAWPVHFFDFIGFSHGYAHPPMVISVLMRLQSSNRCPTMHHAPLVTDRIVVQPVQPPAADKEAARCKERAPRLRDGSGARAHLSFFRLGQCASPFPVAVAPSSPIALPSNLCSRRPDAQWANSWLGRKKKPRTIILCPTQDSSEERRNAWGAHAKSSSSGMCGSARKRAVGKIDHPLGAEAIVR